MKILVSLACGVLFGLGLAISGIRFSQWFRAILPFFLIAWPVAAVFALVSVYV